MRGRERRARAGATGWWLLEAEKGDGGKREGKERSGPNEEWVNGAQGERRPEGDGEKGGSGNECKAEHGGLPKWYHQGMGSWGGVQGHGVQGLYGTLRHLCDLHLQDLQLLDYRLDDSA